MNNEESKEFEAEIRVKQGCVLNRLLFSIVIDEAKGKDKKSNIGILDYDKNTDMGIAVSRMILAISAGNEQSTKIVVDYALL